MSEFSSTTIEHFLLTHVDKLRPLGQKSETARRLLAVCKGTQGGSEGYVVLHGLWAHEKALRARLRIHSFLLCPALARWPDVAALSEQAMRAADNCYVISERTYQRISDYGDPDGILSIARLPERRPEEVALRDDSVVFVLDGLVKPGNVGVILRSCDGAGVTAVLACHLRTRVTHPNAIKASMGAAFCVPFVVFDDAEACYAWLRRNGFTVYIADPNAGVRYDQARYPGRTAVVLGNEHRGPSDAWRDGGTQALFIPMLGTCDSLNVSVAGAILAYEIQSQKSR